jgi:hypothetical protein
MVTQILMYPELNLAIIVLTNQQVGAAFTAIANQIKDSYLGVPGMDWVKMLGDRVTKSNSDAASVTNKVWEEIQKQSAEPGAKPDLKLFTGTYRDPWFGDIFIDLKDGKMTIRAKRSPGLTGELIFYQGQTFVANWNDRSMDADAFVLFQTGYDGRPSGIKMKAISPNTDFSFDFQDLDFTRVTENK